MSKLYPPYIEGVLPAFYYPNGDSNVEIRIPFALNRAVAKKEIVGFELKIKNITANTYIAQVQQKTTNKFSLSENPYVIFSVESSFFKIGQHYKVQIAFINKSNEVGYYSSVGTIKCAGLPSVSIVGLQEGQDNSHCYTYTGVYSQPIEDASEKLYKSRFILKNASTGKILQDSGFIMHNTLNDTAGNSATENYTFTKTLQPKTTYNLTYEVVSVNGLELSSNTYRIVDKNDTILNLPVTLQAYADSEDGYIDVFFRAKTGITNPTLTGYFVLSRLASNKPDEWIQITSFTMNNTKAVRHLYRDFNVEQGITYTYSIQQQNDIAGKGSLILTSRVTSNACKSVFSDSFLSDGTRQLKIRFNADVSTFRKTILENKNETIGSKYPFIFRNGQVNYRELSLSGLISYQMDENNKFIDRKSFLGFEHEIIDLSQDNIAAERKFKHEVEDWLTDGNVKLFRSPMEGNYIVRLMNVSLSPERGVNRMLHSFSCSAYEIDDYTIAALRKHNLLFTQAVTDFIDIELEKIRWDGGISGTLPPDRTSSKGFPTVVNEPRMAMAASTKDSSLLLDGRSRAITLRSSGSTLIGPQRLIDSTLSNFSTNILPSGLDETQILKKVISLPLYGKDVEFNKLIAIIPSYIDANVTLAVPAYQYSRIINAKAELGTCFRFNKDDGAYYLLTLDEKDDLLEYKNLFAQLSNKFVYIGGLDNEGNAIQINGNTKIYSLEIVDAIPGTQFTIDNELFLITKTGSFYSEFPEGISALTIPELSNRGIITYVCEDDAASIFSNIINVVTEDIACDQYIGKPFKRIIQGFNTNVITNNLIEVIENVKVSINSIKRISFKKRPIELLFKKDGINYQDMECTKPYQTYNSLAVYAVCKPREEYNYDNILFAQYLTDAFLNQGYYIDDDGNKINIFTGNYEDGRILNGELEKGNNILTFNSNILIDGELIVLDSQSEYVLEFDNEDTLFTNISYGDNLYCEISYKKDTKEYQIEDADMSVRAAKFQYLIAVEELNQIRKNPPNKLDSISAQLYNNNIKQLTKSIENKYNAFIQILTIALNQKEG